MAEPEPQLQYISDKKGKVQGVIVPIELWREILSERESAYLLESETMRQRLLEGMQRWDGISIALPKYDLDQLLAKVTPDNLHGETDWGPAVGKEVS